MSACPFYYRTVETVVGIKVWGELFVDCVKLNLCFIINDLKMRERPKRVAHAPLLTGIVLTTGSNLSEEDAEGDMYASGVSTTIYNLEGTPYSARGDWHRSFIQSLFANDVFTKL